MGNSDDESVVFESTALNVVGSWLLGGDTDNREEKIHQVDQEIQLNKRHPVTLYRPSSSSVPSLTRPNTAGHTDITLTEQEREMKRKILRKNRSEDAIMMESKTQKQEDEAQDEEEQELVRLKTQTRNGDRKRKCTAQNEILDKLREDASKKKAKNLKRKLSLQRKKQQQRVLNQNNVTATT
ncbi:unnamed protein product [Peronospora belbahrii]|uniref:Uncharacterized protein n=1 Tax=Peronospora belbahrii TaxID=622444 RepID=A0ABN8CPL1_9STRA|nr:unnamed protein product [Peronospora belbahrii]